MCTVESGGLFGLFIFGAVSIHGFTPQDIKITLLYSLKFQYHPIAVIQMILV